MIAFFVILAVLMVLVFAAGQWGRRPGRRVVHVVDREPQVIEREPVIVERDPVLLESTPVVEEAVVAAPTRRFVRRTTRYR